MSERVIELESCWEETAPPRELVIKNSAGAVLLKATLVEPTWVEWQKVASAVTPDMGAEQLARFIKLCVNQWSLPEPVTVDTILRLHPAIFGALSEEALAVITVKTEQIKNSVPLSQSNGSQPSSERAETLTATEANAGLVGS